MDNLSSSPEKRSTPPEMVEKNAHITSDEIRQDIAETQAEIAQMEREVQGFRLIGDRMSHFRADGRVDGIRRRREFIAKLETILKFREPLSPQSETK